MRIFLAPESGPAEVVNLRWGGFGPPKYGTVVVTAEDLKAAMKDAGAFIRMRSLEVEALLDKMYTEARDVLMGYK